MAKKNVTIKPIYIDGKLQQDPKTSAFLPGHKLANRPKRKLFQAIEDNIIPTLNKRKQIAKHFGILAYSWKALKEYAKEHPELVKTWDMGWRPSKDPDQVPYVLNKAQASKFDAFVHMCFCNLHIETIELSMKLDIPIETARMWHAEVKASERWKKVIMKSDEAVEDELHLLLTEGIHKLNNSKTKINMGDYVNVLGKLMQMYKTLNEGKEKANKQSATKKKGDDNKVIIDFGNIGKEDNPEEEADWSAEENDKNFSG